jgi:hypothetical protein
MIVTFVTAVFSIFTVGHLINVADVWEARLAEAVGHKLDTFTDTRGKEKRWVRWLVFVASLSYFIFSIIARIVYSAVLISFYYLMRVVLPVIYMWAVISFGLTTTVRAFQYWLHYAGLEQVALISVTPQQVLAGIPAILITAVFVTTYIALVSVVAVKYHKTFFGNSN